MSKKIYKLGFTLIEVLVALTISGFLMIILVSTFFDTYIFSQEMAVRTSLLSDSKVLLDSMAKEISEGKVDFEEYFQQCVVDDNNTGRHCPNDQASMDLVDGNDTYGQNHGLYAWQFYEGGVFYDKTTGAERIDGAGVLCQKPGAGGFDVVRVPDGDCVSGNLSYSEDFNTGVFGGTAASSICSSDYFEINKDNTVPLVGVVPADMMPKSPGNGPCSDPDNSKNVFSELYLLSEDETKKTIYAKEKVSDGGFAVSKLELIADTSETFGGFDLVDYVCEESYNCTNAVTGGVDREDLLTKEVGEDILDDFVPVTPLKVSVADLRFIIDPMEDASKAFGEFSNEVQVPPRVTILMTLTASPDYFVFGLSEDYELKIQRTVVTSVD